MVKKWLCFILAAALLFGQAAVVSADSDTTAPVSYPDIISGTYAAPFTVTLKSNESGATIYYTLDGTEPAPDHYDGKGTDSVAVQISGLFTELAYRAIDTAGNEEDVNYEFYKIASDLVQPVTATNDTGYYTNYASMDGENLVFAKRVNNGQWGYYEVYLLKQGENTPVAIAANLPEEEEVNFTGIAGDHVIYGGNTGINLYSISEETTTPVYESESASSGIGRVKIDGDVVVFVENYALKVLRIVNPDQPVVEEIDEDFYSNDQYDISNGKIVFTDNFDVRMYDLASKETVTLMPGIMPDSLMLTDSAVYYASFQSLYAYDLGTGETDTVISYFPYWGDADDPMIMDDSAEYILLHGYYHGGRWIGVLNLDSQVVKFLDFAGAYSNLRTYAMSDGVIYWSKEHWYYNEALGDVFINRTPLYTLDLNGLPADFAPPEVTLVPNGAAFVWEGAARFAANEEVTIRYTIDGSVPSATNGYSAGIMDSVPIFRDQMQVRFIATDFHGNQSAVQTSGLFTVENGAVQVTANGMWEEYAAAGNTLVYATEDSKLHLFDIPSRTQRILLEDLHIYSLDFDGRYVAMETENGIDVLDLATGDLKNIAETGAYVHIRDGRVVYVIDHYEFDRMDDIGIYDIGQDQTITLTEPASSRQLADPSLSGNLLVFRDWWYEEAYVYDLNTDSITELEPPNAEEIGDAIAADGKVFLIAEDDEGDDRLWVYDPAAGDYTDVTPAGTDWLDSLYADKDSAAQITLEDVRNNKLLIYDADAGAFTTFGSGNVYFYQPRTAGNVLAAKGLYGLPVWHDEVFLWVISDNGTPPDVGISPAGGTFKDSQTVTFTVYGGEPASVFYTLDGNEPTADGLNPAANAIRYEGPFELTGSAVIKYFAIDNAGDASAVENATFTRDNQAPVLTVNPPQGIYNAPQTVYVTADEPAEILYSVDGTEPSAPWPATDGLLIADDTVLKLKATDALGNAGEVQTFTYTIDPNAPQMSVTPSGGLYHGDVTVTMSVYDEKTTAVIHYTTDGSEPTVNSPVYSAPFTIGQTTTVKYFAEDAAGNRTPVMTVTYEIQKIPPKASETTPADGAQSVLIQTQIKATLDADVTLHHPNGVTITSSGEAVSGVTASLAGRVLTIGHDGLEKGKTYEVQIAADTVRNEHGVGNEPISWSFTTVYDVPSAVLVPQNGATGVATNAPITATFNVPVTAQDLSGITLVGDGEPAAGVSASVSGKTLVIAHGTLKHATTYTVTIPAGAVTNPDGIENGQIEWSFTTGAAPSSSDDEPAAPSASGPQAPAGNDGAGRLGADDYTVTREISEDGRTSAAIQVDADKLSQAVQALQDARTLVLEVAEEADEVQIRIPAAAMAQAAQDAPDAVLSVRAPEAAYDLPFSLLGFEALAEEMGTDVANLQVGITIAKAAEDVASRAAELAESAGAQLLGDLIEFRITVEAQGETREISSFGNTYVTRSIFIPGTLDSGSATAVMVDPATGQMTFVPALFETENGTTRIMIKRNGNSYYTVVSLSKRFADVAGHWAEADIHFLASKMLVSGKSEQSFAPQDAVTRAEFAALVVRALGLSPNPGGAKFKDVQAGDWYAGAVGAAAQAGILSGYEDGTFRPNERITREQMAVLVAKAMAFAGRPADMAGGQDAWLARFGDRHEISAWAQSAVAQAVQAGILSGMADGNFAAKADATRAQAAVMLRRLLDHLEFIN